MAKLHLLLCLATRRAAVPLLVAAPQITDPAILKTLILQKGYKSEGGLLGSMGGSGDAAVGACLTPWDMCGVAWRGVASRGVGSWKVVMGKVERGP